MYHNKEEINITESLIKFLEVCNYDKHEIEVGVGRGMSVCT